MTKLMAIVVLGCSLCAQAQDLQNRSIVHITVDVNNRWFVPVWSITNLKSQTSNNTNLFAGVGYRGKSWWLEGMVQKQWNQNGGLWVADARLVKKFGKHEKTTLYIEVTPFLSQKGFSWGMYGETKVWKGIAIGAETESALLGPRISRRLGSLAGFDVSATGAFRFDPLQQPSKITGHPHEIRGYLVFNRRVALTGRK